jgi:LDH2 family malate/lactate/ureidoglycolate dehydrogenase
MKAFWCRSSAAKICQEQQGECAMAESKTTLPYDRLDRVVTDIFASHGLPRADAARVSECLLFAEMRSMSSHGLSRIPIYTRRLREKLVNPTPSLAVEEASPAVARIDGDNGMGFVVATKAMDEAIKRASQLGIGLVLAKDSSHFGMAAIYLHQAVEAGMAAMVLTNASPAMPVWGGRNPFLGTSPFGLAVPGGKVPIVLDMATSVAARGKIRRAAQLGQPIPEGWALDEEGRPTTDAEAAYKGIVLPLGGPKGSGLSLLMEALAGVMAGSAFGGEVGTLYTDLDRPQRTGHLFLAIRPNLFMSRSDYERDIDTLVDRAKSCPKAEGFDEILMPGEKEARLAAERRKSGVPISQEDVDMLATEAKTAGIPGL